MKKFLLILITCHLSLVTLLSPAVKLCKYDPCRAIDAWKNAGGAIGSYTSSTGSWGVSVTVSPSGAVAGEAKIEGGNCYCGVTKVNGNSCVGSWMPGNTGDSNLAYCSNLCGYCAANGSNWSCRRSALFSNVVPPDAAAVICPLNGDCENADYKTVNDGDSCGSGWLETTGPTLTISGADTKGAYIGTCEK